MDITITPGKLCGQVHAIPSKSQAHRVLICAAFADKPTKILCKQTNQDIEATVGCLNALGANIIRTQDGYTVAPMEQTPNHAILYCRESGSTLRFMLPIVGAHGIEATFVMEGRLPKRPLSPLWEEMERMGCKLSRPSENTLLCNGRLTSGHYTISGGVSSQYITGLLFAMSLMAGTSTLDVTGKLESKPYVDMTQQVLSMFGVRTDNFSITGCRPLVSPGCIEVEGDWSNGAFFLAAKKMGSRIVVTGLSANSTQGDRAVAGILDQLDNSVVIDAADIPDLVPVLAVVAGSCAGATFKNIERLRMKESDRVATVASMLEQLGARVHITENSLTVSPAVYRGCTISAHGDHRIAMAAAIAATVATGPVTILGAECVAKSYPGFWDEYRKLGGYYEQHLW